MFLDYKKKNIVNKFFRKKPFLYIYIINSNGLFLIIYNSFRDIKAGLYIFISICFAKKVLQQL